MSAIILPTLNPFQKRQIQSMDPSFPVDEADFYALSVVDDLLRSAAAFIMEGNGTYECYAFTDPDYRRQGLFSELLDLAIETFPEDTEFLFYTNGLNADCMAAIEALEAELVLQEHMMEINLQTALLHSGSDTKPECSDTIIDGTRTWQYKNPNGSVNISVFSSYYYLYGFEIQEPLRGHGYGTQLLNQVLHDLSERNPLPLRLQVSGDNIPAISLYKKTGFQITETLYGYLY